MALTLMALTLVLAGLNPDDVRLGSTALPNPYGIEALKALGWLTQSALPRRPQCRTPDRTPLVAATGQIPGSGTHFVVLVLRVLPMRLGSSG